MKKCTLTLLAFIVSSHIVASDNQIYLAEERSSRETMSDGNLMIPENKFFKKKIFMSANILMLEPNQHKELKKTHSLSRSPEVQTRLNCFETHNKSGHNKAFIEKICNPNNKNYSIYIELIKNCPQCLEIFKSRLPQN